MCVFLQLPWPVFSYAAYFFAAVAICGIGYQFLVIAGIVKFRRLLRLQPESNDSGQDRSQAPPISVLKPLRGADPRTYECLRSHCLQQYPEFEIIFGVAEANDPAVAKVERLQQEFPSRPIQLLVCPELLGMNRKVSTLVQLLPRAQYDLLLINDSDILAPPDYLYKIAASFQPQAASYRPVADAGRKPAAVRAGMVTTLYRATPGATLASRLEALTIATDFAGGVLSSYVLEGRLTFGLGSTLAVRREALQAVGGLAPLLDYLADDYELGNRIARAGFEVVLAPLVVETALAGENFGEMFRHQLRWARTIRDRRPQGYVGLGVTHVLPWALLACFCSGLAGWSLGLLAVSGFLRFAVAAALCTSVLRDQAVDLDLWLLPLRDAVALLVWIASFTASTVAWRGEKFKLRAGKLEKL